MMGAQLKYTDIDLRRSFAELDDSSVHSEDSNSSTSDFDTYSCSSNENTPRGHYENHSPLIATVASSFTALTVRNTTAKRRLIDEFGRSSSEEEDMFNIRLTRSYSDLPDYNDKENTTENASSNPNPTIICDDMTTLSSPNTLRKKRETMIRASRVRSTSRVNEISCGVKTIKKPKPNILARSVEIEKTLTPSKIHVPITKTDLHLPCIRGKLPEFNSLSGETVCKLIDGVYDSVKNFYIIDCRYQYEYEGGHIKGAINIWDETNLKNFFFTVPPPANKTTIIVFHCEFSSKRGPDALKRVRGWDRRINWERNSGLTLYYPELYLLEGGYATFYEKYQGYCNGEYVRMNDKQIPTETKQRATKLHKLTKRSNSFAGYELQKRTSSSPSKVGQIGTHSSDSELFPVGGSQSAPSSCRVEVTSMPENVAPLKVHTLTQIRRINSHDAAATASLLSPRSAWSAHRPAAAPTGRAALTSTLEIDHHEMDVDESAHSPRLSPAPKFSQLRNSKSKSCSSLEHLPTVYEDC